MYSLNGAKAPRGAFPPRSEDTGIPIYRATSLDIVTTTGTTTGSFDWRPKFGRFTAAIAA